MYALKSPITFRGSFVTGQSVESGVQNEEKMWKRKRKNKLQKKRMLSAKRNEFVTRAIKERGEKEETLKNENHF